MDEAWRFLVVSKFATWEQDFPPPEKKIKLKKLN
jgi:hypothetical protein